MTSLFSLLYYQCMPKLDTGFKLRILHIFNHLVVFFVLIFHFDLTLFLISFLIYCVTVCFGISIGYHRLFSHRSFQAPRWFENLTAVLGCYATGGPPIAWIAHHRVHHLYADTSKEPHSCKHLSPIRLYLSLWSPVIIPRRIVRDLYQKKIIVYLSRHYFLLMAAVISILLFWGLDQLAYFYCIPAVFSFHFFGLISVMGHDRHKEGITATNSWFVSVFTFGEGWHRNHHMYPNLYRIGIEKYQYDVAAFFIERLGFSKAPRSR